MKPENSNLYQQILIMSRKKNNQHEAASGVDAEVRDLFSGEDGSFAEEENPFMLPAVREAKLPPVKTEDESTTEDAKLDKDTEYARNNIYELIEHGMAAVQDLSHIAREHMHPRTYEVLANLIASLTKNNVQLIELTKTKKETKKSNTTGEEQSGAGPTVNNIDKAVFVGSSHDLLKILKQNDEQSKTNE